MRIALELNSENSALKSLNVPQKEGFKNGLRCIMIKNSLINNTCLSTPTGQMLAGPSQGVGPTGCRLGPQKQSPNPAGLDFPRQNFEVKSQKAPQKRPFLAALPPFSPKFGTLCEFLFLLIQPGFAGLTARPAGGGGPKSGVCWLEKRWWMV